ncbi:adenosylcobinamide-GDP ribazoletransferase [Dyella nitratireducens]|uniref:Adenosylcobinamide-GDP ribazoletransferase n=1 Tax=Dyella nitratireducens TaxID=1849580 RepID=A0ABQ1FX69_9GAMM|nr:adenosylcobinamide-GDP ribazoletransferase [Dyella nitratireducens]GGA33151.1 adenosylcobinamide-GDP ribazoletransferase [Dyella nitratireducens]GLQ40688.1 adenosylcobinamide-GDP ribazoletransferase [Dyella nitratireducens]
MRALLVAIGFLTRLPVPAHAYDDAQAKGASLAWYPLVGVLIGLLLGVQAWLLRDTPAMLSSALLVAAWVVLTGALHLDGLADSADAWIGGMGDREKTLAIMKDPRSGPAGVVALMLTLLLKFAALASLGPAPWAALLLAPVLARVSLTALFLTTPYVRSGGLGTALTDAPRRACGLALLLTAVGCVLFGGRGLLALLLAVAVFGLWRQACVNRLGGCTGDTAGALAEMVEVAVLVGLAVR